MLVGCRYDCDCIKGEVLVADHDDPVDLFDEIGAATQQQFPDLECQGDVCNLPELSGPRPMVVIRTPKARFFITMMRRAGNVSR